MLLLTALACSPAAAPDAADLPSRVVVLAPAAAEMLDALEVDDRVVGLGSFGPWPASLEDRPVVGDFDRPNVERLLELECDLVLTADSVSAGDVHRKLERLGIEVMALDTGTYEGIFASLVRVGARFDRGPAADRLARRMRGEIDAVAERAASLPTRSVLFVVGRDPLFVAGPGSHIDALIVRAGGRNVAGDTGRPYAQVSLESMLERNPEVILDMTGDAGRWARWSFLPAVRDGRVHTVDPAAMAIPGLRLPEMAQRMAAWIHPESFDPPAVASP